MELLSTLDGKHIFFYMSPKYFTLQLDHMVIDQINGVYHPVLYINEFWILKDYLIPVNQTTSFLPLNVSYNTYSMWKWQFQCQMEESWKSQEAVGYSRESDKDEMKVFYNILPKRIDI